MVSALVPGSSGAGGHCVVFMGKTLCCGIVGEYYLKVFYCSQTIDDWSSLRLGGPGRFNFTAGEPRQFEKNLRTLDSEDLFRFLSSRNVTDTPTSSGLFIL